MDSIYDLAIPFVDEGHFGTCLDYRRNMDRAISLTVVNASVTTVLRGFSL